MSDNKPTIEWINGVIGTVKNIHEECGIGAHLMALYTENVEDVRRRVSILPLDISPHHESYMPHPEMTGHLVHLFYYAIPTTEKRDEITAALKGLNDDHGGKQATRPCRPGL